MKAHESTDIEESLLVATETRLEEETEELFLLGKQGLDVNSIQDEWDGCWDEFEDEFSQDSVCEVSKSTTECVTCSIRS